MVFNILPKMMQLRFFVEAKGRLALYSNWAGGKKGGVDFLAWQWQQPNRSQASNSGIQRHNPNSHESAASH